MDQDNLLKTELVERNEKAVLGFWIYIMTDCVLFASLFATYAVLHGNTFGGPSGKTIFNLPYILGETLILLSSSFSCGLAGVYAHLKRKGLTILYLVITFLLGIAFLVLELKEFNHLISMGDSFKRSGFLSSYFTLVGTHGLHITIGLIWMAVIIYQIYKKGINNHTLRRFTMLSLFWHFLDVVWIFIFTVVYLMGVK